MPICTYRDAYGYLRQKEIPNADGTWDQKPAPSNRYIGVDLAQQADFTALAVVQQEPDETMTLVALERLRHRPYPDQIDLLAETIRAVGPHEVLVEANSIGRPVTDALVRLGVRVLRVNVHAGTAVNTPKPGEINVPKRDIIAALALGFESRQVRIARGLKLASVLEREVRAFERRLSASGHDSYGARTGEHDDTVIAAALPVWHLGRPRRAVYVW